ncbi:unnamed protein product, partial [Allacma fusca]
DGVRLKWVYFNCQHNPTCYWIVCLIERCKGI